MKHNIVKNYGSNVFTESLKPSDIGSEALQGRLKVEVFNQDGSVDQEAEVSNIIIDKAITQCLKHYANSTVNQEAKSLGNAPVANLGLTAVLAVTDWSKPENEDCIAVLGKLVTHARSDVTTGTAFGYLNESRSGVTCDATGTPVRRTVWDWVPDAGNGTFQSLWLGNSTNIFDYNTLIGPVAKMSSVAWATLRGETDPLLEALFKDYTPRNNSAYYYSTGASFASSLVKHGSKICGVPVIKAEPAIHQGKSVRLELDLDTGIMSTPVVMVNYDGKPVPCKTNEGSSFASRVYSAGTQVGNFDRFICNADGTTFGVRYNGSGYGDTDGIPALHLKIVTFGKDGIPTSDALVDLSDIKLPSGAYFHNYYTAAPSEHLHMHSDASGQSASVMHIFGYFSTNTSSSAEPCTPGRVVVDLVQKRILAVKDDSHVSFESCNATNGTPEKNYVRYFANYDSGPNSTYSMCTANIGNGLYNVCTSQSKSAGTSALGLTLTHINSTYDMKYLGGPSFRGKLSAQVSNSGSSSSGTHASGTSHFYDLLKYTVNGATTYALRVCNGFAAPYSHSLLPAPVTKNDTQSMRITYDVYYDDTEPVLDEQAFGKYIAESF